MIILDDSVMDDENVPSPISVRVGVLLAWFTVSGPAGVGNPAGPRQIHSFHLFFQLDDPANGPAEIDTIAVLHGHTGRIVTTIFEPFQPLDQDGLCRVFSHIADDAAHLIYPFV